MHIELSKSINIGGPKKYSIEQLKKLLYLF